MQDGPSVAYYLVIGPVLLALTVLTGACNQTPSGSPPSPTINPAPAQAGPTIAAAPTDVIATANAVRTQIAPTLPAATSTVQSGLRITGVQLGSSDPTITLENDSGRIVDLTGWTLRVGATPVVLGASVVLPGQSLVLHASSGTGDERNVYLGSSLQQAFSALGPGAQITLQNPSGPSIMTLTVPSQ